MNRLESIKRKRQEKKLFKKQNSKHFSQLLYLVGKYNVEMGALQTVKHSRWFIQHVLIRHKEMRKLFKKYNGLWLDYAAENNQRFNLFREFVKA